jgi:hypothetical protein
MTSATVMAAIISGRLSQTYLWALPALNMYDVKEGSEKVFGKGYNVLPVWKERLNAKTQVTTPNSDVIYAMGYLDLAGVNLEEKPTNLLIIASSIGFGMIPIVSQQFFGQLPHFLGPLLHSGILLTSISAVALNAHFNAAPSLATGGFDPVHVARGAKSFSHH